MLLPKQEDSTIFRFKEVIIELNNNHILESMEYGLKYLVAKELTRIDFKNSHDLEYDFIRIVKQGQEIVVDLKEKTRLKEYSTGKRHLYYNVSIIEIMPTDLKDGNYETLSEEEVIGLSQEDYFTLRTNNMYTYKHTPMRKQLLTQAQ